MVVCRYAGLYASMCECARVCGSVRVCAGVCGCVRECAGMCGNVCVCVCGSVQETLVLTSVDFDSYPIQFF